MHLDLLTKNCIVSTERYLYHQLGLLQWSKAALQLRERMAFMHRHDPQGKWPDVSDDGLLEQADEWLLPYVDGLRNRHEVRD